MKKEVVTFDQALELCKLGFNEVTCCGYLIENRELYFCHIEDEEFYKPEKDLHAPLKQQVFRWFREKFNLYTDIYPLDITVSGKTGYRYSYVTYHLIEAYANNDDELLGHYTYEEAENACIDKLIELVKLNQTK